MNKILKDNLKDTITVGDVKCYSISEALKEDYRRFKEGLGYGLATYNGRILCLDIESECENFNTVSINDFVECDSLYTNSVKQVDIINEMMSISNIKEMLI